MLTPVETDRRAKSRAEKYRALQKVLFIFLGIEIVILALVFAIENTGRETVVHFDILFAFAVASSIVVSILERLLALEQQTERNADLSEQIVQLLQKQNETNQSEEAEKSQTQPAVEPVVKKAYVTAKDAPPVRPEIVDHDWIICPLCGQRQRANRNRCFECAVKFITDAE